MVTRRDILRTGAAVASGAALIGGASRAKASQADAGGRGWEKSYSGGRGPGTALAPGKAGQDYRPVITPGGATLEYRVVEGTKVYHLVAEEVLHQFAPGLKAHCWGYNGRVHGPTLEAVEGDRVRIYVTNT